MRPDNPNPVIAAVTVLLPVLQAARSSSAIRGEPFAHRDTSDSSVVLQRPGARALLVALALDRGLDSGAELIRRHGREARNETTI